MGKHLTTTRTVIAELGGVSNVATITKRSYNCAWNWTTFKKFPANTYDAMIDALDRRGHTAPASLWGQVPRARRPAKQEQAVA